MRAAEQLRVLSLYYSFAPGGASTYGLLLNRVPEFAPIVLRHLCILSAKWRCDRAALERLNAIEVHTGSRFRLAWLRQVAVQVKAFRPDLLLTHGHNGHAVALLLRYACGIRVPAAASYHGPYFGSSSARKAVAPAYNFLTDSFLRYRAIGVASVSEFSRTRLVDRGVPKGRITVIHNGLEVRGAYIAQSRDSLRKEWGVEEADFVIGTVARLEPIKGIEILIEAFARLVCGRSDLRLVIVGSGSHERNLKALVERFGLFRSVTFAGHRPDVDACLAAFDVFVLPSLAENHSIALLEAMRAGKAIAATDVGGNRESVRDRREAFLVNAGDAGALTDIMRELLDNDCARVALGEAAAKRFRNEFTVEQMIRRTADWLMTCGKQARATV